MVAVLVVDDEEYLCEIVSLSLEDAGYEVFSANGVKEAIEVLKKEKIKAIVTDMRMPEGGALKIIENAKGGKNLPLFVVMTGFSEHELGEIYEKGVEAVFTKPFDINSMVYLLDKLLFETEGGRESLRASIRVDSNFKIVYQSQSSEKTEARTGNASSNGFFVITDQKMPELSESVKFEIIHAETNDSLAKGTAICRWVRDQGSDTVPRGFGLLVENYLELPSRFYSILNRIKLQSFEKKDS